MTLVQSQKEFPKQHWRCLTNLRNHLPDSVMFDITLAVLLRLTFVAYGLWQDRHFDVKYTDVDYYVFSQAAENIVNGSSPFLRPTYRYTPLLAVLLVPNVYFGDCFGKVLFCFFDVLTGYLIFLVQEKYFAKHTTSRVLANLWLFNPLPILVSSRGNAESILSVLILATLLLILNYKIVWAGLVYGLTVHFKLYPIIYSLVFYFALGHQTTRYTNWRTYIWPNHQRIKFVFASAASLIALTSYYHYKYGETFIHEAYVYHFTRTDVRHNFSPYFYMLYLGGFKIRGIALLPFIFQVILMIALSIKFCNLHNLPLGLFSITFMFVTYNKVCTSQYFLWYLCLLPLIIPRLVMEKLHALILVVAWFLGQGIWLLPAYLLEFSGENYFMFIWLASLLFFVVNNCILGYIITSVQTTAKSNE